MDGGHQFAVLGNHPIPSRIYRHGGADDRSLLTSSRGVHAELSLPLKRDHTFVVEAGFHHPHQRLDQELLVHKTLHAGHAGAFRSQDGVTLLHDAILAHPANPLDYQSAIEVSDSGLTMQPPRKEELSGHQNRSISPKR